MDVKLAFLTVATAVLAYHTEIGGDAVDSYSAVACQKFPVRQKELYHFVTFPDIADKWLNWMSYFAAADHKALGVGKAYKAIIKNFVMYFKVTEFTAGSSLVMESNFLFRPRVELRFSESPPPAIADAEDESGDGVGVGVVGCNRNNGTSSAAAASAVGNFVECCSAPVASSSSKLIIKLYFQRNSLMFQYTLGTIFRSIFEYQLRESLQNLLAIVLESTTCPNAFVLNY